MANTGSSYLQQARNMYVNGKELQPEAAPAAVPNLYQRYHSNLCWISSESTALPSQRTMLESCQGLTCKESVRENPPQRTQTPNLKAIQEIGASRGIASHIWFRENLSEHHRHLHLSKN